MESGVRVKLLLLNRPEHLCVGPLKSVFTTKLKMSNPHTEPVAFYIKTTAPKVCIKAHEKLSETHNVLVIRCTVYARMRAGFNPARLSRSYVRCPPSVFCLAQTHGLPSLSAIPRGRASDGRSNQRQVHHSHHPYQTRAQQRPICGQCILCSIHQRFSHQNAIRIRPQLKSMSTS